MTTWANLVIFGMPLFIIIIWSILNNVIKENELHKKNNEKDIENALISELEQEGFSGIDGAIDLWNLDRQDDALPVYKRYLELSGTYNFHIGSRDDLYLEAVRFVIKTNKSSISELQKQFKIDHTRASRLINDMQRSGIISEDHKIHPGYSTSISNSLSNTEIKPDYLILKNSLEKDVEERVRYNNRMLLLKELEARCLEIVLNHKNTLLKKKGQMIIVDDYNRKITGLWEKEKTYFLNNIVFNDDDIVDIAKRLNRNKAWLYENYSGIIYNEIEEVTHFYKNDPTSITDINNLSPSEFEQFCADILIKNGWSAKINGGPGDQGVDVIAEKNNKILVVQCKLYSSPIGNSSVQEVFSGMHHHNANHAVVISNQPFTRSAKQLSNTTGVILLHYSEIESLNELVS